MSSLAEEGSQTTQSLDAQPVESNTATDVAVTDGQDAVVDENSEKKGTTAPKAITISSQITL
jgi:hypothetical protein